MEGIGRTPPARGDLGAAAEALVVLVFTAIVAGAVGTFVLGVSTPGLRRHASAAGTRG